MKERIICALDTDTEQRALELVTQLKDHVGVFKVGLELLNSVGLPILPKLVAAGAERIFFDAKLMDIPNTVAGAMRGIVRAGVWCVTVHATGGHAMLKAAVDTAHQEAERTGQPCPKIMAVTVLTSISEETLHSDMRVSDSLPDYVRHLALLAKDAGCDGVIASPQEIEVVRGAIPEPEFLVITPGVRPAGADRGDQSRTMTPAEALRRGASYLVIGRPIVAARDPVLAASLIAAELDTV